MGKLKKTPTFIKDLFIIEHSIFNDNRGWFTEMFNKKDFEEIGITVDFVQDNLSLSNKNVLRGIHFQTFHSQAKLIKILNGSVIDIAVDLRKESKTFKKYFSIELNANDNKMLFIPKGFGHGFLALEDNTILFYKCDDYYYKEYDGGIIYNDVDLNINWCSNPSSKIITMGFNPLLLSTASPIISSKDLQLQTFKEWNNNV